MSDSVPLPRSETMATDVNADADNTRNVVAASAGTLLRQGRQAAGLHIAALAVSLKVPVHRLEALESDRFDLLPDAVFARALASSVCRALKMNAAPVLAQLPVAAMPRLKASTARHNDTYTTSGSARGFAAWRSLPKPVMGSAAALVLGAAALVVWPMFESSLGGGEVDTAAVVLPVSVGAQPAPSSDTPLAASGQVQTASDVVTTVVPAIVTAAASASAASSSPSLPPSTATLTALPAALTVQNTSAASSAPASPASTNGVIVFSPSAASWIEVTDAKGTVVLRRMLAAGEVVGASGTLPLSAVVGRADVTKVQVRGQAFDLSSIARENVARFEVK